MPKYTGLLIDLDDTILRSFERYPVALKYTVGVLSKRFGVNNEELLEAVFKTKRDLRLIMPNLPLGHNRLVVFRAALDIVGAKYKLDQLADISDLFWSKFLEDVKIFDGAVEALDILRENKVKVIVVSDGDLAYRLKKIAKTGIVDHIDDLVASEEVVFEKPFRSLFDLALRRIDKKPNEVVMLGNHLIKDVHGAQQAGIRAGLFSPKKGGNVYGKEVEDFIKPDFVVREYIDLLKEFGL